VITAQVERWSECVPELEAIFPEHFAELALNQDRVPLCPRWDVYADLEARGALILVTLREVGQMVGYFVGMIMPSLHYGQTLECNMDIFFVRKAWRGRHAGLRLFKATRRELQRRGVQRWHVGSKMHKDASRLFRALGMTPIETYYSQWIGG
jgi:hypothetical protein